MYDQLTTLFQHFR